MGYQITTTYNRGAGKTHGIEVYGRQSLGEFLSWARWFDVFANAAFFKDIDGLNGRTINAGVTFRRNPITFQAKTNYRSEYRNAAVAALGSDAYEYEGARTTFDLTLIYTLSPRLSIFASSSNAFNDKPSADRRGSETPEYAWRFREQSYGAFYSLGIRGTF